MHRGRNTSGQVGNFDFLVHENPVSLKELEGQNVSSISAAKHHSAAVADGIAWTWGQGQLGELGRGLSHEYCRPQRQVTNPTLKHIDTATSAVLYEG